MMLTNTSRYIIIRKEKFLNRRATQSYAYKVLHKGQIPILIYYPPFQSFIESLKSEIQAMNLLIYIPLG